jgi:hypothetical protein
VISYRTAYAVAWALEGGGLLLALLAPWPWPGAAMLGAGLLLQWRAEAARQEARWRALYHREDQDE